MYLTMYTAPPMRTCAVLMLETMASGNSSCPLAVQAFAYTSAAGQVESVGGGVVRPLGSAVCVATDSSAATSLSASLAVVEGGCPGHEDTSGVVGGMIVLSSASASPMVQHAVVCASSDAGAFVPAAGVGSRTDGRLVRPTPLAVGAAPRVSLLRRSSDGEVMMVAVQQDGYCFNNHYANTRAEPALCDSVPVSIPTVLSYSYGRLRDFQDRFRANRTVNSCDDAIMHGMWDSGSHPVVALFNSPASMSASSSSSSSSSSSWGVAAVHNAPTTSPGLNPCGGAHQYPNGTGDATVAKLVSWRLGLEPERLNY